MIIDCHTHWGIAWTQSHGEDPTAWLSVLDRHGVDKALLLPHAGLVRPELANEDNALLMRLAAAGRGRLIPMPTVWPQAGDKALAEAARWLAQSECGGLKFHNWLQGFSTADAVFGRICALAGEAGAPILLHDGTPPYSLPEQVGGLARRFPRTRFILGHSGLLWSWRSALEAARQPNVWLCLCGPHLRAIELLCAHADPDRILWGSDFGFGLADQIEYRLNLFLRARVEEGLRKRILHDNPMRVLART